MFFLRNITKATLNRFYIPNKKLLFKFLTSNPEGSVVALGKVWDFLDAHCPFHDKERGSKVQGLNYKFQGPTSKLHSLRYQLKVKSLIIESLKVENSKVE